ncbi:DUF1960-domain-containing protein [Cryphonectria parasitica EP155]|uniref:DUF1960-domain-containing protein n=1 Tax=Cryphonectria parasitica (strain ATCC 38755 / EP155) TaxID=660469 RepID=A0A9P5CTE7_CRYP1|nr:DUF1960-domain-containing protein [Cryphonectria parasitica EP155]KAF3769085.1 DUF1960-domain-containing protein [Cryphonectria parasitica EP155]
MKGATEQTKIHYKGDETQEDFVIFVDDVDEYETYIKGLKDKSISKPALSHFISSFKIFITHKQGAQGKLDAASKQELENEFGSSVDEEVIEKILAKGEKVHSKMPERQGPKNDSNGPLVAH